MSNQQKYHCQWLASLCLLGIAALAAYISCPIAAGMASTQKGVPRCEHRTQVKDYLSHIERVAPVHSVPESGALPFAPQGISLRRLGGGPKVGRGLIGFVFHDEAINWPRHLSWIIRAALVRVNANGKVLGIAARKTERIGTRRIEYENVTGQRFLVSGHPAYYRIDLQFENMQGQKLGSYSEYFRVMKARYRVAMTLSDSDVVPGQTIQARIENLGTEPIKAELNVAIEWYDGAHWVTRDKVYPGGKAFEGRTYVFGGETGPCFTYKVPADLGSGRFRITERIRRYFRGGQRQRASAPLRVSPVG